MVAVPLESVTIVGESVPWWHLKRNVTTLKPIHFVIFDIWLYSSRVNAKYALHSFHQSIQFDRSRFDAETFHIARRSAKKKQSNARPVIKILNFRPENFDTENSLEQGVRTETTMSDFVFLVRRRIFAFLPRANAHSHTHTRIVMTPINFCTRRIRTIHRLLGIPHCWSRVQVIVWLNDVRNVRSWFARSTFIKWFNLQMRSGHVTKTRTRLAQRPPPSQSSRCRHSWFSNNRKYVKYTSKLQVITKLLPHYNLQLHNSFETISPRNNNTKIFSRCVWWTQQLLRETLSRISKFSTDLMGIGGLVEKNWEHEKW